MDRKVGDMVRHNSRVHGPGIGKVVRVTRWRHKTYYHMEWEWESGDRITSKERAGRDDWDWEPILEKKGT